MLYWSPKRALHSTHNRKLHAICSYFHNAQVWWVELNHGGIEAQMALFI
jgi:hypothetical protein